MTYWATTLLASDPSQEFVTNVIVGLAAVDEPDEELDEDDPQALNRTVPAAIAPPQRTNRLSRGILELIDII